MWSLGWQETMVIFLLALLIFGPKKLPELGRNIAKGIAEFRRASSDLKATFDREMANIERETGSLKEITQEYHNEITSYDSYYDNSYDYGYDSSYSSNGESRAQDSTVSASATEGAESTAAPAGVSPGEPEQASALPPGQAPGSENDSKAASASLVHKDPDAEPASGQPVARS